MIEISYNASNGNFEAFFGGGMLDYNTSLSDLLDSLDDQSMELDHLLKGDE